VTGVVCVPLRIGKQTLNIQLFVSPCVEDIIVLRQDVVSRVKATQGQLLLTLGNGEVIDTLTEDNPFRMSFEAIYVSEEDEQDGSNWRVKEDEQVATASRIGVFKSASSRKNAKRRLRRCKEAEQQLVSRLEPSVSQVKEPEHAEEQDNEQRPDVHGPEESITIDESSLLIVEDPTFILVGESLQEYEGKTPRMGTAADLVSPRQDGILEGEMGPYIPSSSVTSASKREESCYKKKRRTEFEFGDERRSFGKTC